MTNEEILRSLPLKDLASLVIRHESEEDWDYTYGEDGEDVPFFWGYRTILVTSDGVRFDEYDYEAALKHECWWLKQEAVALAQKHEENK